ncbi:uncharacterized protein LOC101894034 isoform X1 [Musca domestica]|uniref:Uncharacterized protein LOC101894034 isoform X1 n=1 Tax=Musca domestica TaxID=7370 RepID=A0ABM3UUM5_MUSDO|nr:uncharacterized protein LOC101894034 isoform X1 [Musca domestica]XP_058977233.1 uncharacterized protein LOC101894034 isoform X1 [Musca domestica]XP_058977234.1 uncharacterized protein LOC101894034 isoform X1 [Musca domestica]
MELPSMVQRSGDTLIVRSVVSGNQLYADQQHNSIGPEVLNNMNTSTATTNNNNNNNNGSSAANGGVGGGLQVNPSISSSLIMEQIERLKRSQEAAQQIMQQQLQQQQQQQQAQQNAAMELKEEGLPQCKIKRNYSCSYCTYFTQNPRYHLTHLRDVHGEKIVINKCKLCLYASRHYQKLVRHMKMVHGCTEGVTSGHGQARGKRGMNRDRKRKLEDSMAQAGSAGAIKLMNLEAFNAEQLKADMEQKLNRDLDLFTQQQQQLQHEEQQKSQQQQLSITAANAFFAAAAYEHQLRAQRDMAEKDALRKNDHSNYERRESTSPPAPNEVTSDENYNNASHAQQKSYDYNPSSSSTSALNSNATAGNQQESKIQMPPQRLSYELTPSPSGSNSSPPPAGQSTSGSTTPLSVMLPTDEPSNNRLLKCSLCDFTTLYRNNLLEHEIEDHCDAKFYRCEKCSYVTHIKARFSKHVKYHSMPMIKCVTCDFRTPYKWNLDRHMKNHGGAGPFRCAACDFTADIKQSLTVHEMNHHVPPVGHAAGMTLARRRNKVGGTDLSEDFFSDSAEMLEDHFNNNNMDDYDEMLMTAGPVEGVYESKRLRYEEDEPTDLSQKGGSSDTSSVHNQAVSTKAKKPLPNLIPISKEGENILNLSSDMVAGGRYFNEKPTGGDTGATAAASQLSPTTTIASSSAASGKSLLARKSGSFFDKIKFSTTTNENLICPCGHMAKCLSESIIHRKSCTFGHDDIDLDDEDHDEDGEEGRLEIDFNEDDECDKQSQSALNLSVTGSTRCQHCRHRCKSSADLLNHLKICSEANSRCGDSLSGESSIGGGGSGRLMMGDGDHQQQSHHPMENRVFVWNKIPRNQGSEGSQSFDGSRGMHPNAHGNNGGGSGSMGPGGILSANNDENSYYGVETAPGYGEVTKKMTPEEEAANSSLKKVYKCPHCSFWASTASRFHVHIVGHLNKKPFECSLCSYRSNWRWDITKHIRLKTIRDPSHKNARVLMNDETGRRNYTKYNKYITLMKVTEEDGDPKLMKSGEMTPNQVASLAFINDYNQKQQQQQQQGSVASSGSTSLSNILNGVREDITLEPIPSKNSLGMVGDDNMADNFIRLPLLASMMNAAMAQQQHQKGQQANTDHENATLITPSVTISAVKKNPQTSSSSFKPSDEIILEVRPDSSEKNYKCRKCNFRHMNRDAVLAHVKVHFPDPNAPIVTATATTSPNKSSQLQATGPLQITANSNLYMNKVLAAMCLTQQPNSSANAQAQLSNLVAAGLLDQSGNSALSGLALALAGKSPLKASQLNAATAAANIIEHGEQKAILNDQASAENTMTSPNQLTLVKALQHNSQQQQQLQATSSLSSTSNCGYGPATAKSPSSSSSLQNLLTSPRGGRQSSNTASLDGGLNDTTMVMGSSKTTTTTATTNTTATTLTNKPGTMAITATANPPPPPSPQAIRHCRLKHAGAINIETLDRAATGDRHMAPVYKPLVNGASISDQLQQQQHQSSNNNLSTNGQYSLTLKALQQQNNNNNSNNNTNTNHNNNSVLIDNNTTKMGMTNLPKSETPQSLLSSSLPLTGNSADLQAATVAYLAAAYKAAHSQNGINNATLANITNMAEELLLQQQLQKNDQIEITRVSSSSNGQQQHHLGLLNGQSSNLAQLLESNNNNAMNAPTPTNSGNNNKSKQQKCPLCTYICDSKSQMNYHISLHKPTQYECHLCTFVCAKKQHLSSHMRSVHQMLPQQQQQQLQQQQAFAAASSAALNMDFSLALKVAAAKNQQDSPLAIDLSGMKHNIAALNSPAQRSSVGGTNTAAKATSAASTQHLPPEYQYRLIYYCNRCPARYAQKHNDPLTAKNDLDEHLRQHEPFPNNPDDPRKCLCDYCDYRAAHENLIQAHRHVHTSQYQEKCNELYKNCKDDTVYRAPKLMHITATRKQHQHETIWVVDQDLNEGHIIKMGGQNSSITSSSANAGFEVGNSLLKKQLESKQSSPQNVNEMTHKDDKEESNAPASMSPDISEMENSLEKPSGRESNSPCHVSDNVEKCQHCPFESSLRSEFKTHIQQHICVSQQPLAYTCEHCDYTAEEQDHIDEHTRIHFNSMEKLKDVAFFTSYDKLELSMEQPLNEEEEVDTEGEANNQNEKAKETGNENNLELNIKKEITANNNNDEDRVNENLKQASNPNTTTATTTNNNEANTSTNPDENKSQKCAKIILYKNDGCLSIKKENNNNEAEQQDQQPQQNSSSSSNSQNISERLRRRISRPSGNAISSSSANNNNNNSTSDDQQQSTTTTSHKTILVNAKTGQVISRN